MLNLIKNEFMKIFKRKTIIKMLIISIVIIAFYNFIAKLTNEKCDIMEQYERAYNIDNIYIDNYETLNIQEEYTVIIERIRLEKYAIDNNINYNLLLKSENKNVNINVDARILLMRFFDNFEIIIIIITIFISSTIISEEYIKGTIKNLLIKPYRRIKILFSKIITNITIALIITIILMLFQYVIGGIVFGFNSYNLVAIIYNRVAETINSMSLFNYISLLFILKMLIYITFILVSLLFGLIINNIALNILFSLGLYFLINIKGTYTNMIINNYNISECILGNSHNTIYFLLIIMITSILLISIIFNKKDTVNC